MAPLSRILSAETAAAHQGLTHALLRSYAFLLAVNTVVGAGLFGVTDNGSLSNSYPTEVTPAGWTFAIWGTKALRARGLLICVPEGFWIWDRWFRGPSQRRPMCAPPRPPSSPTTPRSWLGGRPQIREQRAKRMRIIDDATHCDTVL